MPDSVLSLVIVAAILLVFDLLFMGGAVTMRGVSATMGAVAHPLAAGALVMLVVALVLALGAP
jgi:hypothetical protein